MSPLGAVCLLQSALLQVMNILDFGEPTAISRLQLTVTFGKHQNQPRKSIYYKYMTSWESNLKSIFQAKMHCWVGGQGGQKKTESKKKQP